MDITVIVKQPVASPDEMDAVIAALEEWNNPVFAISAHDRDGFIVVMMTGDRDDVKQVLDESFSEMPVVYI